MFPHSFHYHRASSLPEAAAMLAQLGAAAKLLAGGQSLVPLMKLRLAQPAHLVDLGFVPDAAYIRAENGSVRLGAMARHAEIAESEVAARIPILHDDLSPLIQLLVNIDLHRTDIGAGPAQGRRKRQIRILLHIQVGR